MRAAQGEAFAEATLGCGAMLFLLAYALVRSKVYCDCSALWRRASARLWALAAEWRVGAGFALAMGGSYLMFLGARRIDDEAAGGDSAGATGPKAAEDGGFKSPLLRTHRRWFTRAQIMRSLAAVVVLNVVLSPLQKTTGETVEEQVGWWETGRHTAMVSSFLLLYVLSHDRHRPQQQQQPVG